MSLLLRCLLLAATLLPGVARAAELADLLRAGTHVLLVRHAHAPGVGDPPGFVLERCETQRLLDEQGRQQAARVGHWLRTQGVDAAAVYSSPWCRCAETAGLLRLGPVSVEPSLGSFFEDPQQGTAQTVRLQQFITRALRERPGRPLVLVTHHVNIRAFTGRDVGVGDAVLARVDERGRIRDHRVYPSP